MVALLSLAYRWLVTINVLWFFLTVPWVGLQWKVVLFLDHTHLLFKHCKVLCAHFIMFPFKYVLVSFTVMQIVLIQRYPLVGVVLMSLCFIV